MNQNKYKAAISMMGFVPALVELPAKQSFKSVVMFTDISGFTNLTETLSKLGNEGPELTAFVINRYMELLVKAISKSGGDILKFAGDAMIVAWPPSIKTDIVEIHEDLRTVCRMAIQNALDIQNKLNDTCILNNLKLSVKIGFGVGDINIIYVGGVFGRSEYLATGEPLTQAFKSEHCATKGGQTIVSSEVYQLIKDFFEFDDVPDHPGFYYVNKQLTQFKVKMKAEALLIKNSISMNQFEKIKNQISMYIPAALKPYIEINQEKWSSELRRVTTLFLSLGIDLSDAKTDQGLQRIQNVIKTVQKCVYMYEGSLNKLLMDDKGSTLIVVFGLPPASHQNDAVRGIQSAFLLEQELRKIKCKIFIGISTGVAFCGVVGTSGSRREYSILGDCVNLAARLMQLATQPLSPPILIDECTAQASQQRVQCIFWNEKRVKGKSDPQRIYEPMKNFDDFRKIKDLCTHYQQRVDKSKIEQDEDECENEDLSKSNFKNFTQKFKKKMSIFNQIEPNKMQKLKSMPVSSINKKTNSDDQLIVGVTELMEKVQDFIQKFLDAFKYSREVKCRILMIYGEYGIGKSYLIKNVLSRIEQIYSDRYNKGDSLEIMIAQLNPASKTKPLNSIKIILRNMFLTIAQRLSKQPSKELIQQIYSCDSHTESIISIILSLGINEIQVPSQREDILIAKQIKNFVSKLVSQYLNQEPSNKEIKNDYYKQSMDIYEQSLALILVVDDMQDVDEGSMMIYKYIMKHFRNVALIGLIRDSQREISAFAPPTLNIYGYREGISKILKADAIIQNIYLQGLNQLDNITELLQTYFSFRSFICPEEDKKNLQEQSMFYRKRTSTSIVDIQDMIVLLNKVRDPLMFYESKPELESMDFNTLCLNYIYIKTKGHPLKIINILNNLINENYITINLSRQVAIVNEKFKRIIAHEEWLEFDPPLCTQEVNGPIIDKLTALQILILKQACVIGDIFDIQTLNFVNPFKDSIKYDKSQQQIYSTSINRSQKSLLQELTTLTQIGILDIMNVEEENIFYRFTYPFFRELLYQRMTYSQRRQIHKNVALSLQRIPQPLDYHNKKEFKRMEYHWTQSSNKIIQVTESNDDLLPTLTPQVKKSLIIQKISQLLDGNLYGRSILLHSGYILKRSEKGLQWNWRYCAISSESLIVSQEDDNPEHIVTLPLKAVLAVSSKLVEDPFQKSRYYQITIDTNCWSRANQVFQEFKKMYFAVETEDELTEWTTYLEFSKAYAVYVDFVSNFGRISFPITCTEYNYQLKFELAIDTKVRVGKISYKSQQDRLNQSEDQQLLKERIRTFLSKTQQVLFNHIICTVSSTNLLQLGSSHQYQQQYLIHNQNL